MLKWLKSPKNFQSRIMSSNKHIPVLAKELIESINIKDKMVVIDCTLGRGGHSQMILDSFKSNSTLIAFDQDSSAIEFCKDKFSNYKNIKLIKDNFFHIDKHINKPVDAIIMDIGVSSPQLDNPNRGFSYQHDGLLDMRMNQEQDLNAKIIINKYSFEELIDIFYKYGEEKYSKSIAKAIIREREIKEISTTQELVDIIKRATPASYKKLKHPAKKIFQALRIEVNNELTILSLSLKKALNLLKPKGTLAVITFHSLEDRIVKKYFKKMTTFTKTPKEIPLIDIDDTKFYLPYRKPIKPNQNEIDNNRRAKSATLRVIRRKG